MSYAFLDRLNEDQRAAATHGKGPALIVAGAGSGKTATIISRLAYLIKRGVKPSRILLLTFTRKAAEEMLIRASALIGSQVKIPGGTFHGFANSFLHRYLDKLGYNGRYTVLDVPDSETVLKLVIDEDPRPSHFPKKEMVQKIISLSVNSNLSMVETVARYFQDQGLTEEVVRALDKVHEGYRAYKRKYNFMDFDDLLYNWYKLLLDNEDLREEFGRRFRFVMCDEYQDTNVLQDRILKLTTETHDNLVVCGDPRQSIYAFRAAEYKNILHFADVYTDCKIFSIGYNYRSTAPILEFTNSIFKSNEDVKLKNDLLPVRNIEKAIQPIFYQAADDLDQANYAANVVQRRLRKGVDPSSIAVICRSSYALNHVEIELARRQVPFVKYGGQQFTESIHVKDMLHLMRLTVDVNDTVAWTRILGIIPNVGPVNIGRILDQVLNNGLEGLLAFPKLRFHSDLQNLHEALCRAKGRSTPSLVVKSLLRYYEPLMEKRFKSDKDEKRKYDLQTLLDIASSFKTVRRMINDLTIDPTQDKKKKEDCVVLATCHYVKGMEFDTVLVISIVEGIMPSKYAMDEKDIEEERRIFYVATTRAENYLFLCAPCTDIEQEAQAGYSYDGSRSLSRFITENEQFFDLVKHVQSEELGKERVNPFSSKPNYDSKKSTKRRVK